MLTEPASKVSVPLTVVMRTRSRVPEIEITPEVKSVLALEESAKPPKEDHIFEDTFDI